MDPLVDLKDGACDRDGLTFSENYRDKDGKLKCRGKVLAERELVRPLQTQLRQFGFGTSVHLDEPPEPKPPGWVPDWGTDKPSGVYDAQTRHAVREFQREAKTVDADKINGLADATTLKKMLEWRKNSRRSTTTFEVRLSNTEVFGIQFANKHLVEELPGKPKVKGRVWTNDGTELGHVEDVYRASGFYGLYGPPQESGTDLLSLITGPSFEGAAWEKRAILEVYRNEGGRAIEAINQYDNAFLSVGLFQWILGTGGGSGELPGLFSVDNLPADAFEDLLGKWGLEHTGVAESKATPGIWYGRFKLDGSTIQTADFKEELRSFRWAYRFYKACQDPRLQLAQYKRALGRLRGILRIDLNAPGCKEPINAAQLLQSEQLRALALDQYVNRPGHVWRALQDCVLALYNPKSLIYEDPEILDDGNTFYVRQYSGWWYYSKWWDLYREGLASKKRPKSVADLVEIYREVDFVWSPVLLSLRQECEKANEEHPPPTVDCEKKELSDLTVAQHQALMRLYRWWRNYLGAPNRMTHADVRWQNIVEGKRPMGEFPPLRNAVRKFKGETD